MVDESESFRSSISNDALVVGTTYFFAAVWDGAIVTITGSAIEGSFTAPAASVYTADAIVPFEAGGTAAICWNDIFRDFRKRMIMPVKVFNR